VMGAAGASLAAGSWQSSVKPIHTRLKMITRICAGQQAQHHKQASSSSSS
jgi:hypothetical protein